MKLQHSRPMLPLICCSSPTRPLLGWTCHFQFVPVSLFIGSPSVSPPLQVVRGFWKAVWKVETWAHHPFSPTVFSSTSSVKEGFVSLAVRCLIDAVGGGPVVHPSGDSLNGLFAQKRLTLQKQGPGHA